MNLHFDDDQSCRSPAGAGEALAHLMFQRCNLHDTFRCSCEFTERLALRRAGGGVP